MDKPILTRTRLDSGMEFIFCTSGRALDSHELGKACERWHADHVRVTLPGEALFVDLRPAFNVPFRVDCAQSVLSVSPNWASR